MARLLLSLDGQLLAEYNMSKERYTIGRLPENDIRIDQPAVSAHHALIINILNDSYLEDLNSTNGTYVNGKPVKKYGLQNGDVITVGEHQLHFVDVDLPQDEFEKTLIIPPHSHPREKLRAAPRQARLQVLSGAMAGREMELVKTLTTLGRPDSQVAAITRRAEGFFIVHVDTSGESQFPLVNGISIGSQARKLVNNDVIELAGVKLAFFES